MVSKYFKFVCDDKGIVDLWLYDLWYEVMSVLFEDGWDILEVVVVIGYKDWWNLKCYMNFSFE